MRSHVHAFEYFGGAPKVTVPDQLRSAVRTPSRYEPTIARTYSELGRHYGTAIVPARPGKPRDNAEVEVGVQIAQRWILARLRHETFFSLERLNRRITKLLEDLNARPMKELRGVSRRDLFDRVERAALLRLPDERFVLSEWKRETVNRLPRAARRALLLRAVHAGARGGRGATDGHDDRALLQEQARGLASAELREISLHDGSGAHAGSAQEALRGYRCGPRLGVVGACAHAPHFGARSYKPVERLLALGREQLPLPDPTPKTIAHENVRGPGYFH